MRGMLRRIVRARVSAGVHVVQKQDGETAAEQAVLKHAMCIEMFKAAQHMGKAVEMVLFAQGDCWRTDVFFS